MVRPTRWLPTLLAATVTAALLTAAGPAVAAAAPPDRPDLPPSRVTLLTGDVVEVAAAGGGRYAATVQPGPGRESITVHTMEEDGKLLVLPSDVIPYVSAGLLDERLFDVPELIAQGYGQAPTLPLIVRYRPGAAESDAAEPGALAALAPATARLDSIDGAALAPARDQLGQLWTALTDPGTAGPAAAGAAPRFAAGVAGIWLDGRVAPVLDRSVPQIGAPAAWQAGYDGTGVDIAVLDTGVDASHPDLAGQVSASQNFTDSPTTEDRFGHGTHVAAIAAGTGAAGRAGVAPGANLLAGKVLNDSGVGSESWIITGMEWAAAEGAEVVNLSLGGGPSDGTDPLSQAVNRLTAESGTLFVIAAGNDGADYTVSSPGTASAALTVGAVDRDDRLAEFSSRGPRWGDHAIKPEITAPGVGIVAARAAGTALGTPLDADYTAASGTSMATPHVAGAAALVAQAHPDWTAGRLKDALASTAEPDPERTVFEQGGGRLDAARAVTGPVHATGTLDLGLHHQGKPSGPVEAEVAYTNRTDAPVTLELAAELANLDQPGDASPALTLGAEQVTVPAGGRVSVPVRLDLDRLARGKHGGRITATGPDGDLLASTAVGATLTGPTHTVTFRGVGKDGAPAGMDLLALRGPDRRTDHTLVWVGPEATLEVEEGSYLLQALIPDFDRQFEQATLFTDPELEITGDRDEIVLDVRTAVPVEIQTPRPSEQQTVFSYYVHRVRGNGRATSHGVMHFSVTQQLNVTPTEPVHDGEYEFSSRWQLVAPMVDAQIPGVSGSLDINLLHQSPAFDRPRWFRLVDAGTGTPEELAALPRGAAALLTGVPDRSEQEQIAAAAAAGAAAVLIVRAPDFPAWTVWRPVGDREPIPAMVVGHRDGQRILDRVRGRGGLIRLELTVASPYLYDVVHVETGRVPDRISYRVTPANSARFQVGYTELGGFGWLKEQRFGWRPWQQFAWNDTQRFLPAGQPREEWVTAGDTLWQHRVQHEYTWEDINPLLGGMTEAPRSYRAGRQEPVTWFGPVVRPAAATGVPGLASARIGDRLELRIPEFADSGTGHYRLAGSGETSARLLADGEPVAELPDTRRDVLVGPEPADYRLELTTRVDSPEWQWATRTETAWEFRSRHTTEPEPLPLLQLDYHVPADLRGEVSGWLPHPLRLGLRDHAGPVRFRAVQLELSWDDGATWRSVPVARFGDQAVAMVPSGPGALSLRVHAESRDGGTITQTVLRAYGLR